jgi:SPP1 family predicted phage head-tail adaptor
MGSFNFRVQFLRYSEGKSASGQRSRVLVPVPVGTPDNRLWCNVRYPNGMEQISNGADASIVRASIRLRFRTGIDADMVAEIDGRHHQIEGVLPTDDKKFIDLAAKVINLKS